MIRADKFRYGHIIAFGGGFLVFLLLMSCNREAESRTSNFPRIVEVVSEMPSQSNFWIFVMAGQSNMAGRGFVEPQDTIPDTRVFSLDANNKWILAKEPLHYYEPDLTGLDCGLSFGKKLASYLPDSISIGLIPCAVGGTSLEQWTGDTAFRGVKLKSNLKEKIRIAEVDGTVKAILWHQGENDASRAGGGVSSYRSGLYSLFRDFRTIAGNDSLPIIMGELGDFLRESEFCGYQDTINSVLKQVSSGDPNIILVRTKDLAHKGDFLHFNSSSLRILGERFAESYLSLITISEQKSK